MRLESSGTGLRARGRRCGDERVRARGLKLVCVGEGWGWAVMCGVGSVCARERAGVIVGDRGRVGGACAVGGSRGAGEGRGGGLRGCCWRKSPVGEAQERVGGECGYGPAAGRGREGRKWCKERDAV